jgi:hypothetical protein
VLKHGRGHSLSSKEADCLRIGKRYAGDGDLSVQ